ncbi:MAG TPA: AIM24 family protein [Streptosporangiaceae bacterium]
MVKGTTMPVLEVMLERGESVYTPHGELVWMSKSIHMSQTTNTGGGGLLRGIKRMMGGGGLFVTKYEGPGQVTFAARLPGQIVPVDIAHGEHYLVHKHGWLASTHGVRQSVGIQHSIRGGLFGGEGFILQKLEGEGTAWIEVGGELMMYDLAKGEQMLAHPGHIGMFAGSVKFSITRVKGIRNMLFGHDGLLLAELTGPGRVWLQSMPVPILAGTLSPYVAEAMAEEDDKDK